MLSGAIGGIVFAASVMVMIGAFLMVVGMAAIFDDDYFVVSRRYVFDLDIVVWGWIYFVLGFVVVVIGFGLFMNKVWVGVVAIVIVGLIVIDYFFFIFY